ncbi:MAG: efflux RND transporter periplasmic adaptor subunit [Bacteroidales bacterium]|nr:efflux RND transporter periplasmic adaptor subunit [Bacteroidales bacterium]
MKNIIWVLLLPAYLYLVSCQSKTSNPSETKTEVNKSNQEHEGHDHAVADEHEGHDHAAEEQAEPEAEHEHGAGCVHGESDNEVALHRYLDNGHIVISAIQPQSFNAIINTAGEVLPATQETQYLVAGSNGTINFTGTIINGSDVNKNQPLFKITAKGFTEDNTKVKMATLEQNYLLTKSEFERAQKLVKNQLISTKEFNKAETAYQTAKTNYDSFKNSFKNGIEFVKSPFTGIIDQVLVQPGEYVEMGQQLAVIRQPNRIIVKADISAKYYPEISSISKAVITTSSGIVFDTEYFDGKRLTSKSTAIQNNFISIYFEMEQPIFLPVGDYVEVALYGETIENVMLVPQQAFMEEQGNLFLLVETGHLEFEKVYVTIGASDGEQVEVTSGIHPEDKVVVEGATIVKLATTTSSMPAETHSH